ncbi:MAG: hypothetical protein JW894_11470 [Bacteroidales bacterium]|nr:hypothetical protein [Bacteroidales bacterium]
MRNQLTLVAQYGEKDELFISRLNKYIDLIKNSGLEEYFSPYKMEQIHGTLIGLECVNEFEPEINNNIWAQKGLKIKMDLRPMWNCLDSYFPMNIRVGGYNEDEVPFLSNNEIPYLRSFFVNLNSGKVVLMGWPMNASNKYCSSLWEFRQEMERNCNTAHKYQNDNDYYFVLGTIDIKPTTDTAVQYEIQELILSAEAKLRKHISKNPIEFRLQEKDISMVRYINENLDPETSEFIPLINLRADKKNINDIFQQRRETD